MPALETTFGQYNDETLDALDEVIVKLSDNGIKALISPYDANSFYELQGVLDAYDARLSHILNYEGAKFGRVWKEPLGMDPRGRGHHRLQLVGTNIPLLSSYIVKVFRCTVLTCAPDGERTHVARAGQMHRRRRTRLDLRPSEAHAQRVRRRQPHQCGQIRP